MGVEGPKVVMLGETPLTPAVLLSQLLSEGSGIEAVVAVVFFKHPDGKRLIEVKWSDMKIHDFACASIVLDMRVRDAMSESTEETS